MLSLLSYSGLPVIAAFLSGLVCLVVKFTSVTTQITVLEGRVTFLEGKVEENIDDLKEFEKQMLHYLERIDNKIDQIIIGNQS